MFDLSNYLSFHFQLQKMEIVAYQLELSKRVQERVNGSLTFFMWRSCISKFVAELSFFGFLANRGKCGHEEQGLFEWGHNGRKHRLCRDDLSNKTKMKIYTKMTHTQGCSNHICVKIIGN